jgi:chemotaxis protein CheD
MGIAKNRLQVKLAGGAEILNDGKLFSIGRRNHTAIRKVLWQHGLMVSAEQVGGTEPRTVYLHLKDGTTLIKNNGQSQTL